MQIRSSLTQEMCSMCKPLPRVGVSVLSLFPYSSVVGGLQQAWNMAQEAGLDGLQLLPVDIRTLKDVKALPSAAVMSFEGDWRPNDPREYHEMTWWQCLKNAAVNQVVFGNRVHVARRIAAFRTLFPKAIAIDTGPDDVIEMSPNHRLTHWDSYPKHTPGVVVDTWHIRERQWRKYHHLERIHKLVDLNLIRLVHVQTRDVTELILFRRGIPTRLAELTAAALKGGTDVIIELPPWIMWDATWKPNPRQTVENLRVMKARILELAS